MKTTLRYALFLLFCIASCREVPRNVANVNEVKVNSFDALKQQFPDPPAEYTTAPFFVWNAEITKDEIYKDLASFRDAGSEQVFVHPRPGLVTEYLSDEWFSLFRHTVDKGKELGMKVWIYDENSYPSGFAGGHVPAAMPESFNEGQGLKMIKTEMLPDTSSSFFICLKEADGELIDITGATDNEAGKKGRYFLFSKTYHGKSPWYGGFSYVDLLREGVTEKFIEITMAGYEKHMGDEFGKTVPGTFTDEPHIHSPGGIRWTPDLFEEFSTRWGYDLKTCLPSLFEETGDWKKVRHNYTETLLQLFIDRWAMPWYDYCESKGLIFTGHYWEHEWPNFRHGGDNMAMYAWHHLPAIDMLFNQWNDVSPNAQFGNVRSVKELASVANQTGRQRKLSETYGGSGWELSFTEMKRNGDWEYALGVNLMNQHLNYFTMAGARKYDYPPTFDYHEPWWNNYKYINDHYARLSLALSAGTQDNDILVLEPTTTTWMYDSYTQKNPKHTEIGQSFQSFITALEKNQVEYDLGSENIIRDLARVTRGKMIVGKAKYSRIVIPPMTENLNLETYRLLERFVAHGGELIAFSKPGMINGAEHEGIKEFFKKRADRIFSPEELSNEVITEHLGTKEFGFADMTGGTVYHHRRRMQDGQLLFIANSDTRDEASGKVTIRGKGVAELNTLTGVITRYPAEIRGNEVTVSYTLPAAGSLLLFVPERKLTELPPSDSLKPGEVQSGSAIKVTRVEDNALMIDFCDVETRGEKLSDVHTFYAADKVFKAHGLSSGNPWNTSVQYRRSTVEKDTFGNGTGFTATYRFNVKDRFDMSDIRIVVERPEMWNVAVNGSIVVPVEGKWWLDREFAVFPAGSLLKQGENTITLSTSPMKIHAEIEPVYVIGSFSLVPAAKGWDVAAPEGELTAGSWKKQGLPYYSWSMDYSRDFVCSKTGKWLVRLGEWNGTVAEVMVNGQKAGIIAFPPYLADVSKFIREGNNTITVRVTGSLKNLLGPHHNNPAPGLTSPWTWRNVKVHSPGESYQFIDYGLFREFDLVTGL